MGNKCILLGIILGGIFGLICYIACNNIYASLFVLIITILEFAIIIRKRFCNHERKMNRFHESYHFINNFIVSLSVKGSIKASLENAILGGSESFKDEIECIHKLSDMEKLLYLKKYFHFHTYQLFIDILLLWIDEGGDILEMTGYLTNLLRNDEEYVSYAKQENSKVLSEFSILWMFSLAILFSLRFVLNEFYSSILKQTLYPFLIAIVFIFLLGSIELLTRRICNIEIKGWNDEK